MSIIDLQRLYTDKFDLPVDYYETVKARCRSNPAEYIQNPGFLHGITARGQAEVESQHVEVTADDVRIDAPVWFGDLEKATERIVIIGYEPRHTDNRFNIVRSGKKVFGCPFGADRWNYKSSIKYKPQNHYLRALEPMLLLNHFILLTDAIKEYLVVHENSAKNDELARDRFSFAEGRNEGKDLLSEEIKIVAPTLILTFGRGVEAVVRKWFPGDCPRKEYIRHPAQGGSKKAKDQIADVLSKM